MKTPTGKRILTTILAALALTTSLTSPAAAGAPAELVDALTSYRLTQTQSLEFRQQRVLGELRLANGPYGDEASEFSWAVERWRPVVEFYFPADRTDWALRIVACESGGNPDAKNRHSTASGLFQHLGSLWDDRAVAAGWEGSDVFDPFANIAVAAWLLEKGGTGNWVCKA